MAAGNVTVSWSKEERKVWIWGWSGGTGVANEVTELRDKMVKRVSSAAAQLIVFPID